MRSNARDPELIGVEDTHPGKRLQPSPRIAGQRDRPLEQDLSMQRHLAPGGVDRRQHENGGTGRLHHADRRAHAVGVDEPGAHVQESPPG